MTRISVTYISPRICKNAVAMLVSTILLAGCSSYSVVPTKDLKAERAEQQTLQAQQQKLAKEVQQLQTIRTNLESHLAVETRKRKALEAREAEFEQAFKARRSAEQALASMEQKCEELDRQGHAQLSGAREDDNARLYLLLLEKKAQIDSLTEQLEAAILEVVRTKAKLRSVDSKAEAASNLAEAEIAVQKLRDKGDKWGNDASVIKADELTKRSTVEFTQGNFSGALYLTGEAKNVIKSAQARSINQGMFSMMEGEVAFVLPLTLRLLGESEVREGPGDHYKVLSRSDKGTALVAYSYLGQWVHVASQTGDRGWVFYKQVAY